MLWLPPYCVLNVIEILWIPLKIKVKTKKKIKFVYILGIAQITIIPCKKIQTNIYTMYHLFKNL